MKKELKTNVITTVFFVATIVTAQFRPNVFPHPVGPINNMFDFCSLVAVKSVSPDPSPFHASLL